MADHPPFSLALSHLRAGGQKGKGSQSFPVIFRIASIKMLLACGLS
jgi:hypothetical protein